MINSLQFCVTNLAIALRGATMHANSSLQKEGTVVFRGKRASPFRLKTKDSFLPSVNSLLPQLSNSLLTEFTLWSTTHCIRNLRALVSDYRDVMQSKKLREEPRSSTYPILLQRSIYWEGQSQSVEDLFQGKSTNIHPLSYRYFVSDYKSLSLGASGTV